MKLKLLKSYEGGKKGDIIDVADKDAAGLKIRGIATKALDKEVKDAEKEIVKEKNEKAGPNAPKTK